MWWKGTVEQNFLRSTWLIVWQIFWNSLCHMCCNKDMIYGKMDNHKEVMEWDNDNETFFLFVTELAAILKHNVESCENVNTKNMNSDLNLMLWFLFMKYRLTSSDEWKTWKWGWKDGVNSGKQVDWIPVVGCGERLLSYLVQGITLFQIKWCCVDLDTP